MKKSKVEALRRLYFPVTHQKIYTSKTLDIYQKKDEYFVPLFYTELGDFPKVEYSSINPTLYKVRIHGATKPFQLIFTDNYHSEWRLYEGDMVRYPDLRDSQWKTHYTITPPNQSDQASTKMVEEFLKTHTISVINDRPNFISKEFRSSVQNDNLKHTNSINSLLRTEVHSGINHINNRGLNLWDLNPTLLCKELSCTQEADGSYSFEVLVEFQPQRLVMIGYGISILSIGILLIGLMFKSKRFI